MTISINAKCYVPVFIRSRMNLVRGDRCLKDYGIRLPQAADSAEVSYAMTLLPFILLFYSVSIRTGKYAGRH